MPLWHYLSGSVDTEWGVFQSNLLYSLTWKSNKLLLESHSLYWIYLKFQFRTAQETHIGLYLKVAVSTVQETHTGLYLKFQFVLCRKHLLDYTKSFSSYCAGNIYWIILKVSVRTVQETHTGLYLKFQFVLCRKHILDYT